MPDPDLTGLLRRLDVALCELAALRHELQAFLPAPAAEGNGLDDDFATEHLLDTASASARFNYPRDTIAKWCRQGDGRKVGGRWMADVRKVRARINGGRP